MNENELIEGCRRQNRKAQQKLFDHFAPKMIGLCMRYVGNRRDAEELMIEGMFKVMTKIDQYSGNGSFEGWMRRIMVNECLMFLRKQKEGQISLEDTYYEPSKAPSAEERLMEADILALLDRLPTGYRLVFNLYVIEGYKHREIADILGISINTSKSQLILARKRLRAMIAPSTYNTDS